MRRVIRLEVYVDERCFGCERSLELADYIRQRFPQVAVHVIDSASLDGVYSHLVAATPTYIMDGDTIFLGNPSADELERVIGERVRSLRP